MRGTLVLCVLLTLAVGAGVARGQQEMPIAFITVADVHQLIERGTAVLFIDVRGQQEYLARHITGAISIPLRTLPERSQEIPRERLVVLYWACPHELASLAYKQLYAQGYRNLRVLDEGIPGWIAQGYPTEGGQVERPPEQGAR